jgi:putative DNA primase/helicase
MTDNVVSITLGSTAISDAEYQARSKMLPAMRFNPLVVAQRVEDSHSEELRYVPKLRQWFLWDGVQLRATDTEEVHFMITDGIEKLWPEIPRYSNVMQLVGDYQRMTSQIQQVERILASRRQLRLDVEDLDRDPSLFNCLNGTLELREGEATLRDHRRDDNITKLAPVNYREDADCPTWRSFLETILDGDPDLIGFVQRLCGACLTGRSEEQYLPIFYGTGANGKSTLINVVHGIFGDYSIQLAPDVLMSTKHEKHPTALLDLRGVRFASSIEIERNRYLNEPLVKMLTGGDTIRARKMHQDYIEFAPSHQIVLAANYLPQIRGADQGIWRRILVIPFAVTIPEHDRVRHYEDILLEERDGILAWMVDGYHAWHKGGLQPPDAVQLATAQHRSDQDQVGTFVAERCQIGPGYWVDQKVLREAYVTWCDQQGEQALSPREFGNRLTDHGYTWKGKSTRQRQGLRILETAR